MLHYKAHGTRSFHADTALENRRRAAAGRLDSTSTGSLAGNVDEIRASRRYAPYSRIELPTDRSEMRSEYGYHFGTRFGDAEEA